MDQTELLARTVEDLQHRVTDDPDDYSMLRAAALLRQLLLDKLPLAPRIAGQVRFPLRFQVGLTEAGSLSETTPEAAAFEWVNPVAHETLPKRELNLEQFLAVKTVAVDGVPYSVREVIRVTAHVLGGVHYFDPETEREEHLLSIDGQISVNGMSALREALRNIGIVVVDALTPLTDAVRSRPGTFG